MRHYGLPVRLLDWTESILTAAFFALCLESESGPAAIWALAPGKLNQHYTRAADLYRLDNDEENPPFPLVMELFQLDVQTNKVLAVLAPELDNRMAAQQSTFTIHGLRHPLEEVPESANWLMKFIIPETTRAAFENDLREIGMRHSLFFPDLEHLSRDLKEGNLM